MAYSKFDFHPSHTYEHVRFSQYLLKKQEMHVQRRFEMDKIPDRILKMIYSDKTTSDFIGKFA